MIHVLSYSAAGVIPAPHPDYPYRVQNGGTSPGASWTSMSEEAFDALVLTHAAAAEAFVAANQIAPVAEIPQEVPMWALRDVVEEDGFAAQVEAFINALPQPFKRQAYNAWNYGNFIERTSPTVAAIQQTLGLTSAQVDNMFVRAGARKV